MKRRKRIVFVQPVQSPYWTERLRALARDEDLDVGLILERATFAHRPGWSPEPIPGVSLEVLGSAVFRSSRASPDLPYTIRGVRAVPWRLPFATMRNRPDVLVLCNATQVLLALMAKYLLGFRIALIVEDTPHSTRNVGRFSRLARGFIYRRADKWFAFSDDALTYLRSIGIATGVTRSSWSLDMSSFGSREEGGGASTATGAFRDSRLTVLFSGRLVELKGIRQLLDSWAALSPRIRASSRLVIAGEGPLKEELESLCQRAALPEVEILGNVPYEEMKKWFMRADLFVLPTLQDLFSLTVLEAMAAGCPVITTPFNGARELIEEGKTGWIVDPTGPGLLTRALEMALSGEVDLTAMGRAARERVAEMDNERVMSRFADEVRTLARDCA